MCKVSGVGLPQPCRVCVPFKATAAPNLHRCTSRILALSSTTRSCSLAVNHRAAVMRSEPPNSPTPDYMRGDNANANASHVHSMPFHVPAPHAHTASCPPSFERSRRLHIGCHTLTQLACHHRNTAQKQDALLPSGTEPQPQQRPGIRKHSHYHHHSPTRQPS
jgi:hypothetical protein